MVSARTERTAAHPAIKDGLGQDDPRLVFMAIDDKYWVARNIPTQSGQHLKYGVAV